MAGDSWCSSVRQVNARHVHVRDVCFMVERESTSHQQR